MKYTNDLSQCRVKGKTFRTTMADIDVKTRIWLFRFFIHLFWTKFMQKKLLTGILKVQASGLHLYVIPHTEVGTSNLFD